MTTNPNRFDSTAESLKPQESISRSRYNTPVEVQFTSAGCLNYPCRTPSGGDVHEIIGPLVEMQRKDDMAGLLAFTRMRPPTNPQRRR